MITYRIAHHNDIELPMQSRLEFCLTLFLCILLLLSGCGSAADERSSVTLTAEAADNVQPENPHGLMAFFQDGNITVSDTNSDNMLIQIPLSEDEYALFLSMTDDKQGCLLYCSSPAAGIMMKHLYITKDRWATYEEKDLSSLIDGYPTSLSALSMDQIYIGTQMRSNGYLFGTTDGGNSWTPVTVDDKYYQYGYILPVIADDPALYALLEYTDPAADAGAYVLCRRADASTAWEKIGSFMPEDFGELQTYYILDGALYIADSQGIQYQVKLP